MGLLPSIPCFSQILVKCQGSKNRLHALLLHHRMHAVGLESHRLLGNYLVPLLVEVGNIHCAHDVLDLLTHPNDWSYCSLISGYVKSEKPRSALHLYPRMLSDRSICISGHTFLALLKACKELNDPESVIAIHNEATCTGLLEKDTFLSNALVDVYAKCGLLWKSQEVLDKIPIRDAVSWTTLISGYAEHQYYREAFECFEQMKLEGIPPDPVTLTCILTVCSSVGDTDNARRIHAEIEGKGFLQRNVLVGNTLINTYAKLGLVVVAQYIFDCLQTHDGVSWTTLITGYADCGHGEEALACFDKMQLEGFSPNGIVFVCILNVCGDIRAFDRGVLIHGQVEEMKLLKKEGAIGNALVDMYGRFGMLAKATELFDELTIRDVVSWTAQISGYIQHGYNEDALKCFDQMRLEGLHPSVITYSCILKACGAVRLLNKGQEIHAEIERRGLLSKDLTLGVCLVDMYAKCDMVARAQQVFDEIHARTVVLWTSLISGYADHGPYLEAVKCLGKMQLEGIAPNIVTLICILKAYAGLGDGSEIEKLYVQIEQRGWFEGNLIIGNALVNAYAKCGCLTKAQQVFDRLPLRDVASWNALITGLLEYDYGQAAVECFKHMQLEGIPPNEETLAYGLKACRTIGATGKGCEIRDEIEEIGLFERDIVLGNTLIDMYAKFGWFSKALEVFEGLVVRDVVSWNALIAGYVEHEDWRGALEWFEQMQVEGVSPDSITLICGLKACGRLGAAHKGQQIHADSERKGLFEQEIVLGNALIDMYAKCNMLTIAQNALHKLPVRDVVTWSALIGGYGQHGHQNDVFYMFEKMVNDGIRPDSVTFSLLLNACSRTGSSEKSRAYFKTMSEDFAIVPTLEHLNSVIDLLCRAGQLGDAEAVMDKLPFWPDLVVWHSILSACRNCGNRRLAKKAFKNILHLDGSNSAAYVLMSYICAGIGVLEALPERVG